MRRQFELPPGDVAYLDATGLPWETVVERSSRWLLLHDRPTHDGYEPKIALTALQVVPGYPESALDMVWFHPGLFLKSGRAIRNLSLQQIDGRWFQRWSRHRTPGNPWRPGLDDVAAHLLVVDEWLAREVR